MGNPRSFKPWTFGVAAEGQRFVRGVGFVMGRSLFVILGSRVSSLQFEVWYQGCARGGMLDGCEVEFASSNSRRLVAHASNFA